jgi:hypothetical protein
MEVSQPNCFISQAINVRCLSDRISIARELTVSLIVCHNDDHVGLIDSEQGSSQGTNDRGREDSYQVHVDHSQKLTRILVYRSTLRFVAALLTFSDLLGRGFIA